MNRNTPTVWFWNLTGLALVVFACGVSWSLLKSSNYKLETANHRLEVYSATSKVKQISDELEQRVRTLPIAEPAKRQIKKQLEDADSELDRVNQKILTDESNNQDLPGKI